MASEPNTPLWTDDTPALCRAVAEKVGLGLKHRRREIFRELQVPVSLEAMRRALDKMWGPGAVFLGTYAEVVAAVTAYNAHSGRGGLRGWLDSLPGKACVYLHRYTPQFGHWLTTFIGGRALGAKQGRVEFFDSMGGLPDSLQREQPVREAAALGQADRVLVHDLGGAAAYYSDRRLQKRTTEVCGRWCVLRLLLRGLTDEAFAAFILDLARAHRVPADVIVAAATTKYA